MGGGEIGRDIDPHPYRHVQEQAQGQERGSRGVIINIIIVVVVVVVIVVVVVVVVDEEERVWEASPHHCRV